MQCSVLPCLFLWSVYVIKLFSVSFKLSWHEHKVEAEFSWTFINLKLEHRYVCPLLEKPDDALWREAGLWGKVM